MAVSTIDTAIREEVMPMELIEIFNLFLALARLVFEIIIWRRSKEDLDPTVPGPIPGAQGAGRNPGSL